MSTNCQSYKDKQFSAEKRCELNKYIEENSYMNISEADYSLALMDDGELLKLDIEVINHAYLIRNLLERKKRDEAYYNAFLNREKRKREIEKSKYLDNGTGIITMGMALPDTQEATSALTSFNDTLNKFMNEKKIDSYVDLCKRSNLNQDTMSKMRKGVFKTPNRDFLFALAIGLGLDLEETEKLFNSCGQSTKGCYRKEDEKRERAIEYFIKNGCNIDTVNDELFNLKMPLIGNYSVA